MKILITDGFLVNVGGVSWKPLEELGEVIYYDETAPEQLPQRLKGVDALFTNRVRITADLFQYADRLKMIGVFGTGVDFVDGKAARAHGVAVCNIPGYGRGAVAQMVLALMFEICRRTSVFDRFMKEKEWVQPVEPEVCSVRQMELTGKTLGIIGMGDIGYAVARAAMAMDMKVLAYRRHPKPELESDGLKFVDLDTLYRQSDLISLNCPLTEETRHIIDRKAIEKMKPGVILLNAGRGALFHTQDVVDGLNSGKLYMVGTDVLDPEPSGKDHPLAGHPRCVATPHVAWSPLETRQNLVDRSAENLRALLSGAPIHVTN